MLSVTTLTWDQLHLTKKFVESIRRHTKVPYELVMVDNGSGDGTRDYIKGQADKYHFFKKNTGFSHGFNKAISLASGEYIAICNNDTEFPANWFPRLKEIFDSDPKCGLVFPSYTRGLKIAKRWWPGKRVVKLEPFGPVPSGVVILSKLSILRDKLGGFAEDYEITSGEDRDLCFTAWKAGYNIYVDERVLIKHKSKGTVGKNIPNWQALYKKNAEYFRHKWKDYIKD